MIKRRLVRIVPLKPAVLAEDMAAKVKRVTRNLGTNTAKIQDECYTALEAVSPHAKCTDGLHEGERSIPVRQFYLNKGGKGLQGACIVCQKNRRKSRIVRSRDKFKDMTPDAIRALYVKDYGATKQCSKCKTDQGPEQFTLSISMECGLHNQCITCAVGNSQGNGGLRDFLFMPDKDGIKYKKKAACERCAGVDKLAVDHILPIAKGGTDCITNKQTLCVHCNSKKSDTIDCVVTAEQLSKRYRSLPLIFTDFTATSQQLARKVHEFRAAHIDAASLETIRTSLAAYKKEHNLGHNIDSIVAKISLLFRKT